MTLSRHAVVGITILRRIVIGIEANLATVPGKFPDSVGQVYRDGVERGAEKPNGMLAGFAIGDVGAVVGLSERPLGPGTIDKAKIAVEKRHHRDQGFGGAFGCANAIEIETWGNVGAEGVGFDLVGDDRKVCERGADVDAGGGFGGEMFGREAETIHGIFSPEKNLCV